MEGSAVPPPGSPRQPDGDDPHARGDSRRLKIWRVVVTLLAVAAAAGAGYAISEIESTKDENREDDQAVNALRGNLDVAREQLAERVDALEQRVDDAAEAQEQRELREDVDALDRRVQRLNRQDDASESDEIATRVDDLEQRIEDLEDKN